MNRILPFTPNGSGTGNLGPCFTNPWHYLFLGILFLSVSLVFPIQGQESDLLKERFLQEAPKQWEEYGEFLNTLQGKCSDKHITDGKISSHAISLIKQNRTGKVCERQFLSVGNANDKLAPKGYVFAINPEYGFTLTRTSQEKPWVVTKAEKRASATTPASGRGFPSTKILKGLIRVRGTDLPSLVKEPTFKVLQAKAVMHEGIEAVQIDFDNPQPDEKVFSPRSGSLILDPASSWCIRAGNVLCKDPDREVKAQIKTTFRDPQAKKPIPLRVVEKWDNFYPEEKKRIVLDLETDFELESPPQLPGDKEFRLTAYGMPELTDGTGGQPIRWYLWFSLAGILALAMAAGIQWFKNSRAKTGDMAGG